MSAPSVGDAALVERVCVCVAGHPETPPRVTYGTAGFRAVAETLPSVMVRVGIIAALRALSFTPSRPASRAMTGVMITASHNPVEDNGVKIVDADGGMMAQVWEQVRVAHPAGLGSACHMASHVCVQHATALANARISEVADTLRRIIAVERLDVSQMNERILVAVGRDTRPSSPALHALVCEGIKAAGATVVEFGIVTTPQLHHVVRVSNMLPPVPAPDVLSAFDLGPEYARIDTAESRHATSYTSMFVDAYKDILAGVPAAPEARGPLVMDAANGVGGQAAVPMVEAFHGLIDWELRNTGRTDAELAQLNVGVGAEHAQKERKPPAGFTYESVGTKRCASLDGDADRLVYHYFREVPDGHGGVRAEWRLLDGDKIACLCALFLREQLDALGLPITAKPAHDERHDDGPGAPTAPADPHAPVSVGIVQTAYANGASTRYVSTVLGLPSVLARTGVKYVHAAAHKFDIGVYFEANGHGTVVFHPSFVARLQSLPVSSLSPAGVRARTRLLAATRLINQAMGDAISDALFVEAVLTLKGLSVSEWDDMYTDLPSRQVKIRVKDRAAVRTTEDETRVTHPPALQDALDGYMARYPQARMFVRPSGTEDVVRVYAEAGAATHANHLAFLACLAVNEHAGGMGVPQEAQVFAAPPE